MPPVVALLVALPFWRRNQPVFGSLAGTVVLIGVAFGLIMRDYVEIDRLVQACLDEGIVCWPAPSAFTRFAIYAFIALLEVCALFLLSLQFEERARRRNYAQEWQRW